MAQQGAASFPPSPTTLQGAFLVLLRYPRQVFWQRWNWKSALLSSLVRGLIFFFVNLKSGWVAAGGALLAEFALRAATAGFYGAFTQSFRSVTPSWQAFLATGLLLPVFQHSLEFLLHWLRGTPQLLPSIAVSACFTLLSTGFNLFAMRQGTLVVGGEGRPLHEDLARVPGLIFEFLLVLPLLVAGRRFVRTPQ